MEMIKYIVLIIIGIGSGIVISGAVFAFIAIIGVVPRLAQKTHTERYIKTYEEVIIWGGIWGTTTMWVDYYLPIGNVAFSFFGIAIGIFYGILAVSLAEVLDVLPILARRARLLRGMKYFVIALAIGKMVGSILYYLVEGFYF